MTKENNSTNYRAHISIHCQISSLEPMRTRAQNSKCVECSLSNKLDESLKNRFHHRQAGRNNQRLHHQTHNTTITATDAPLAIPQLWNMQEPQARRNYVTWDLECSPLRASDVVNEGHTNLKAKGKIDTQTASKTKPGSKKCQRNFASTITSAHIADIIQQFRPIAIHSNNPARGNLDH